MRDTISLADLELERPFDLGGDDPKRLNLGLPVLLDALPRSTPKSVLCFRTFYGQVPLVAKKRWPDAQILAVDRDLLGTEFTRRNSTNLRLPLEVRECAHFSDALKSGEHFDLILGELSPSAGDAVMRAEILAILQVLAPQGQALLLCLDKLVREWALPFAEKNKISLSSVITREGFTVLRLRN